jgi:(R,R)-butanediol dehydrogenase/meso-butanediol dehydrogenase/diacetyl reductase
MKMAVLRGIKDLRVEEVEEATPGANEAKIKVKYCGICGSDLHEYLHGPFPESPFGHEACGEIVEMGPEVKGFHVGDRVIAFEKDAYAEYMTCPQERMMKISEEMSWKRAAVVEPLAGAAYAIQRAGVERNDTVLIAGAGPVGLMLLIGVQAIGVKTVFVTEVSQKRREKAKALGATLVLNPEEIRVPSRIKEITSGRGVDVAIEAVGIETALKDCLSSVRYQGKVIVQGIFTNRVPIHMLGFVTRETTMFGVNSINPQLAMIWIDSKGIVPESIITKIVPLDRISEGFDLLTGEIKEEIKILVEA